MSMRSEASMSTVTGFPEVFERRRMSLEEFYALPEKWHVEYRLGEAIVSPPAPIPHQAIAGRLVRLLGNAFPDLEVFQEGGVRTVGDGHRVPDVMVLERLEDVWWLETPPILAVEILSPSSRTEDLVRKPEEYRAIGIEQYWILDPDQHRLTICRNADDGWTVVLELDADQPCGEVTVGAHGTVSLDIDELLVRRA